MYIYIFLQVLLLKELAMNTPTFFFQQVQQFFDNIFNAIRDPKVR
jgi:FKBP12-rapamycin complex-associated protein